MPGEEETAVRSRNRREDDESGQVSVDIIPNNYNDNDTQIFAVKLDETSAKKGYDDEGGITLLDGTAARLAIIGINIDNTTEVKFTTAPGERGAECGDNSGDGHFKTGVFSVEGGEVHISSLGQLLSL